MVERADSYCILCGGHHFPDGDCYGLPQRFTKPKEPTMQKPAVVRTSQVRDELTVVVCGGRNYRDKAFVFYTLALLKMECRHLTLIEGGCKTGADLFARQWAALQVQKPQVKNTWFEYVSVPVTEKAWDIHGKAAGPLRSRRMLEEHQPDFVIAFEGGRGTKACVDIARELGIEVREPKKSGD